MREGKKEVSIRVSVRIREGGRERARLKARVRMWIMGKERVIFTVRVKMKVSVRVRVEVRVKVKVSMSLSLSMSLSMSMRGVTHLMRMMGGTTDTLTAPHHSFHPLRPLQILKSQRKRHVEVEVEWEGVWIGPVRVCA